MDLCLDSVSRAEVLRERPRLYVTIHSFIAQPISLRGKGLETHMGLKLTLRGSVGQIRINQAQILDNTATFAMVLQETLA